MQRDNRYVMGPVYDLMDEILLLKEHGWLRRQITWLLKQLMELAMDSRLNKVLNESVDSMTSEKALVECLRFLERQIWPNGELFKGRQPPSAELRAFYKTEALDRLLRSIPVAVKALVGKDAVEKGVRRLFLVCQIRPLVLHLAFTLADALVKELFHEARQQHH
jgi:hypothetical protein